MYPTEHNYTDWKKNKKIIKLLKKNAHLFLYSILVYPAGKNCRCVKIYKQCIYIYLNHM